MEIIDFLQLIGVNVEINFRKNPLPEWCKYKFYTSGVHLDLRENGLQSSASGNGNSPDEAMKDLANNLSNKTVRHHGREFKVPELIHTKEV